MCLMLFAASLVKIHFSLSISISTYSESGFSQIFVTPKIVSGLKVAVGIILSSYLNLIMVYCPISGSISPMVSCWPTGFPSLGHQPTG